MTSIRHFGWTALATLALVGCDAGVSTNSVSQPAAPAGGGAGNHDPVPSPTEVPKDAPAIKSMPLEPGKGEPAKAAEPGKAEEPKGAAAGKLSDEEIANIKKLAPEDQAIAMAQLTCPVSGDNLGEAGMGAPIKQVVQGKTFFLCCSGCEKEVKANPDAVLAKLKK